MENNDEEFPLPQLSNVTRRTFINTAALVSGLTLVTPDVESQPTSTHPNHQRCSITVNKTHHDLQIEPRVTLLDLFREHLHMYGTKKGCDHGQCGACTVLADGHRIVSCLALAIAYDGAAITTIEGLAEGEQLHPMQAAFLEKDGFQCGFCTSGQICSAVGMLGEARSGMPSAVSKNLSAARVDLTEPEIRERMSGNICRCGAYPNIVAAIQTVQDGGER